MTVHIIWVKVVSERRLINILAYCISSVMETLLTTAEPAALGTDADATIGVDGKSVPAMIVFRKFLTDTSKTVATNPLIKVPQNSET